MHKSDIFIVFSLAYLGGIFFSSFLFRENYAFIAVLVCIAISLIGIFWKQEKKIILSVSLIIFSIGYVNYSDSFSKINEIDFSNIENQQIKIKGLVVRDYAGLYGKRIIIDVEGDIDGKSNFSSLVYLDKYTQVSVGDEVEVIGKAMQPTNFSDFDYIGYLAKEDIYLIVKNAKIININQTGEKSFLGKIAKTKEIVSKAMEKDFIPSHAPVVQAMVLGESEKMSNEYKEKLARTGLSHAIAISGSHFTLIAIFLSTFFFFLGLRKNQVLCLVIIFIIFYIILISFPSSAVRAGIMISIVYSARILNRQPQEWRLLILSALLMNMQNPMVLKHDLGFQLSFLAVLGLIYLSPLIDRYLKFIIKDKLSWIREILSATLAAQIAVAPLLLYATQQFSLSGVIANILIVPVMPFCLGAGFVYALTFYIPIISEIIAILSFPLIYYLNLVIDIFAAIPFSYFHISIPSYYSLLAYVFLITWCFRKGKKEQGSILNWH